MKATDFAAATGSILHGLDPNFVIRRLTTLESAGPNDAAPLTGEKYLALAQASKAGLLLVPAGLEGRIREALPGRALAVLPNPWSGIKWLLEALHPDPTHAWQGIHPTAVIHESAKIGKDVWIGPYAVIGPLVEIGDGTRLAPSVVIGTGCRLGQNCSIHAGVVLEAGTVLGSDVTIQAGAVLGADGFKYEVIDGKRTKIPQVGIVRVDDKAEIGANTCVDRASLTETVIGANTKIDNLVQIGHNVTVGRDCVIVSQTGIAGSCILEDEVILAGQVGIADHVTIGRGSVVLARGAAMNDVPPRQIVMGEPTMPRRAYLRILASRERLPEMVTEMRELKAALAQALERIEILERQLGINTVKVQQ
jgi:UDP-3-O-[3-hydroxymyristoyl] glucosamine N-acyltransferase